VEAATRSPIGPSVREFPSQRDGVALVDGGDFFVVVHFGVRFVAAYNFQF
jgi:hypothetical protein